jgi:hypothetical protein
MGLGVQAAGSDAGTEVLQRVGVSSVIREGTLFDQSAVVATNGVLPDGGKGDGLMGALAEMLNLGDQFHRLVAEPDAELLGSIGMVVHWC